MQNKPIFYGFFRSSASWRVRIALLLKKVDYEFRSINLDKKEQKTPEYTKISPLQVVPTLVIDGFTLFESLPIIQYLDEAYPEPRLLPKDDPMKKAQILGLCETINSSLQPYLPKHVNLRINALIPEGQQQLSDRDQWQYFLDLEMPAVEKIISNTRGKYCFGDEISLADIFLYAQVDGAFSKYKIDFSIYPNIYQIYKTLEQVEEFERSKAKYCPDFNHEANK